MKKHSKSFWIKLISGTALGVAAMVTTLSVMLPSYLEYKTITISLCPIKRKKNV